MLIGSNFSIRFSIQFKLCLLAHLTLIGKAPTYIADLLQPILAAKNTDTFKRRLKTVLFCKFYDLAYPSDFV